MKCQSLRGFDCRYQTLRRMVSNCNATTIAPNTTLLNSGPGEYTIVFHRTPIVKVSSDGTVRIDNGGYMTASTKDRINQITNCGLYSKRGVWYVGKEKFTPWMEVNKPATEREAIVRQVECGSIPRSILDDYDAEHA